AKAECGISDEIAHAIRYHTTGTENMTVLDEIVYLADKTAAGRRYESLPYVRYLCEYDKTLAMYYALSEVSKLKDSEACVHSVCALGYRAWGQDHSCRLLRYSVCVEFDCRACARRLRRR
ncbi:MAG: hypothetical protein OSJ83_13720, partial [Clostridia bacterium]|nr:hypothetical protein [Clostridia bacterium]